MARFARASSRDAMQPGEWCLDLEREVEISSVEPEIGWKPAHQVLIRCPSCGTRCYLGPGHAVFPDGAVTPSIVCPLAACGDGIARCAYHEFIVLERWAD